MRDIPNGTGIMIQGSSEPFFEDPDIVRVVRCRDCDRSQVDFDRAGNPVYRCILFDPVVLSVEDDGSGYCSNGRRKE